MRRRNDILVLQSKAAVDRILGRSLPSWGGIVLGTILGLAGCSSPSVAPKSPRRLTGDLSIYQTTDGSMVHEVLKTSAFLVPVGEGVPVPGLECERGVGTLTQRQLRLVSEIFNCLEEITENTVGDTNAVRSAEFKKMEFEIRAHAADTGRRGEDLSLAQSRASEVMKELVRLGTPSWRLSARGVAAAASRITDPGAPRSLNRVELVRMR